MVHSRILDDLIQSQGRLTIMRGKIVSLLSVMPLGHFLCCIVVDPITAFESLGLRYVRPLLASTFLHGQPNGEGGGGRRG